ncbi:hypothetical protein JT321_gp56 [Providencia phage Kokobel1]|uniref:Uncharacterized protein n=1 Tax=Providencia phage Kokobel1 TaxID=2783540 RepID=A0A873WGA6_9CAUD|nr:hypothetical protein JT321_gp56 [Providencia phage Kokobel1]QPB11483.1 hypothetical protein [Providencia phage Kokobel1]
MFRRSEKVTVNGFFGAPRSGVVIHPGSWWSGVAHVLFDGDQTVTAVPRRLVTREIIAKAEDFEQLEKYCNEDVSAEKAFAAQCGSGDPDIHGLPRETVKSPLFAAPYGSFADVVKDRHYVVDRVQGRIYKWRGFTSINGTVYGVLEFGGKMYNLTAESLEAAYSRADLRPYKDHKTAKAWVEVQANLIYSDWFVPGTFFSFDGSARLWQVADVSDPSEGDVVFTISLCCDDERSKPVKTISLDALKQAYRSGHTKRYADFNAAVADLSDKSPMVYFDPSAEEEY